MPEYKLVEVKPEEAGLQKAEMLAALVNGLIKKGIKTELAEKIAVTSAAPDVCGDGHCLGAAKGWQKVA